MSKRAVVLLSIIGILFTAACGGPNTGRSVPLPTEDTRPEIITAILDADPIVTAHGYKVSIRFVVKEPVAKGFTLGQVVIAEAASRNATLVKGTMLNLTCNSNRYCNIKLNIIATPTPSEPH